MNNNLQINLLLTAIITNIITIILFKCSHSHDRCLLLVMLIGQYILMLGEIKKSNSLIQIAHIIFTVSTTIGSLYFSQTYNKIFILFTLLVTIISRYILSECLFNLSNQNYEFEFEKKYRYNNKL